MIRTLSRQIAGLLQPAQLPAGTDRLSMAAAIVFATHPIQLSRWLDEIWAGGGIAKWPLFEEQNVALGDPEVIRRLQLPDGLRNDGLQSGIGAPPSPPVIPPIFQPAPPPAIGVGASPPLPWDHMIYPYLVESTGVVEIFTEVLRRYVVGETLDAPTVDTLAWVRLTEELFFRDPPLFHIGGLTSQLRPDARINRRNAYWRMFGTDLPHPLPGATQDVQPWKRDAGAVANTRFLELWTELLRQVWMGIENDRNQVGSNPTDKSYVAYLCQTLGEMLRLRRRGGMLAREEFSAVALLSWFHLTLEVDSAVVRNLQATAGATGNPADRLNAIGQRVGIAPPRQARELFELADLVSPILWFIELDRFSSPADAEALFRIANVQNTAVADTMIRVVDLWQSATGEPLKDAAVRISRPAGASRPPAQPARLPSGPPAVAAAPPVPTPTAGNGARPAVRS
jgi:hypothetical protein